MSDRIQSSDFKIGQAVNSGGREGIIAERVGPMVRIKFRDGLFEWIDIKSLEGLYGETYLKDFNCPFCKGVAFEVKTEKAYSSEHVFQCMKCSQRFSVQRSIEQKFSKRAYCKNCGKKSGVYKGQGVYECESCSNKFNQGGN